MGLIIRNIVLTERASSSHSHTHTHCRYCYECVNKATGDRKCIVCGGHRTQPVGKMIFCELCPRAYHHDCYIPPMIKVCAAIRRSSAPSDRDILSANSEANSQCSLCFLVCTILLFPYRCIGSPRQVVLPRLCGQGAAAEEAQLEEAEQPRLEDLDERGRHGVGEQSERADAEHVRAVAEHVDAVAELVVECLPSAAAATAARHADDARRRRWRRQQPTDVDAAAPADGRAAKVIETISA